MELRYVVQFDLLGADAGALSTSDDVVRRVLAHVTRWINHDQPEPSLTAERLEGDTGRIVLAQHEGRATRGVEWHWSGTSSVRLLRLSLTTDLDVSGVAAFVCQVSVLNQHDRVVFRVELGRELRQPVLAPTGWSFLRRPALLIHLLKDPELEARASGVLVTSDASRVDGDGANGLWERLSSPRLLPTVLVDGSRHENAAAADYAAAESVGLAEVAHLNGGALAALAPQLAEIDARIPPGGAVLVWPDLTLRHKWWTSGNLHNLPGDLVRVVAPLSVRARGVNALARTAAAAERDERNRLFEERLHASETADMTATVATQAAQIQELTRQEAAWVEEIENLETQLEETQQLARQAEFWRYEAARLRDSTSNDDAEPAWSNLPRLTPSDITSLARDLERRTDRAISFTPRVARAWTRSRYPHVDAMESALVALAKAAEEYRASGAQTGGFPDDWFKTLHNLNMAGTDKGLRQTGEDTFTFEDTKYSREPHLKLDDVVSPNEVGRVYFALDSAQLRIIVDHVGLKLYGL